MAKGWLYKRLSDVGTLENAWLAVLAHYPRDAVPHELQLFEEARKENLRRLSSDLSSQRFVPEPATLIWIPKPQHPDEKRKISLVRPDDRIVLTALNRLLEPLCEPKFLPRSYGYRRGRSALQAVQRVDQCLNQGAAFAAGGDIDNFFDSINRHMLVQNVRQVVWERPVLRLLELYLHMGAVAQGSWVESEKGISQGSPLSPLLSNLYLMEFDKRLEGMGVEWVRYADNFILLGKDRESLQEALRNCESFLAQPLGLRLNDRSRFLASRDEGFVFLGFLFRQGKRSIGPAKIESIKGTLREHLARHPTSLEKTVGLLRETILGWRRYYGSGNTAEQMAHLQTFLFDLMGRWLSRYMKQQGVLRMDATARDVLMQIELPAARDDISKKKWVELLLARAALSPRRRVVKMATTPQRALSSATRRAVEKRRQEWLRRRFDLEEVIVTRPGTFLGKSGERLVLRREGKKLNEIPLAGIRHVTLVSQAGAISGDLMVETARRGIAIHILSSDGRPAVQISAPAAPQYRLSLAQAALASSAGGLDLARRFVLGKIRNQANLLRYYGKYSTRPDNDFLDEASRAHETMTRLEEELKARRFEDPVDVDAERARLFALEGQAAGAYWRAVRLLVRRRAFFEGRVRKGARDLVNSLLNYGYGILYSRLLTFLVGTGLNPNISFLHTPRAGKTTLLFDFIEEFRPVAVDRVVMSLLGRGSRMGLDDQGLTPETRARLAREILQRMRADTRFGGARVSLLRVMELQAELLSRHVEGKEQYESYVLPW